MKVEHPVTIAVTRPDGSVEHVRIGTAVPVGDSFRISFGELLIGPPGEAAPARAPAPRASAPAAAGGGMVFPPYGRSKGQPVAGATVQDLEYYASGCRRTLADPSKSRWHDKERQLLAAIEAELARNGVASGGGGASPGGGRRDAAPRFDDDDAPAPRDEDLPF